MIFPLRINPGRNKYPIWKGGEKDDASRRERSDGYAGEKKS